MKTVTTPEAMRRRCEAARREGRSIGLVPTMGYLHEGHLSLVRRSRAECDLTVVSVFVNPTQFAPGEDLGRYPRDLARDARLLEQAGADVLFAPAAADVYRPGHDSWVEVPGLSAGLCGPFRPGHFRGVATVVAKLFNIVRPDAAWFGQKDAQQAAILKRMAEELDFGIRVVVAPTVRESDGLAMSSRNAYLTPAERREAPALYAALLAAGEAVRAGERSGPAIRRLVEGRLAGTSLRLEYVEVVGAADLRPIDALDGEILVAVAAHLGATRLIDNVRIEVPGDRGRETAR